MADKPRWESGSRMVTSLRLASTLHSTQARKKDNEPYLGHLLGVAALVIEYGGTEDQACAALLHDAIEDQDQTVGSLAAEVGDVVAALVDGCTESYVIPEGKKKKEVWAERKHWYLDHLRNDAHPDAVLVALADKVNNCEKTLRDFHEYGNDPVRLWAGFNAGDTCQAWWYRSLVKEFRAKNLPHPASMLVDRFHEAVEALFAGRELAACTCDHQHHDAVGGAK